MKDVLVVYYSRDGHTRAIAGEIARACDAEIEEIVERSARNGPRGYTRSVLEAIWGARPPIRPLRHTIGPDELLVIGTPIWGWNMSSPVRSFVAAQRASMRKVAFFCTYGGAGAPKVFADLRTLCGLEPVATLAVREQQCATGEYVADLARFVQALKSSSAAGMAAAPAAAAPRDRER